jgi:hypothetical protein
MSIYSNNYYVYAYLRAIDNTPYYIGKGKGNRAFSNNHATPVPKDKSKIIFLEKNLTNVGALALERRYIRWYGRKDINTGILRNKTDGGDGGFGYKHTLEHKKYISSILKGKSMSEESRRKLSKALMGRKMLPHVREILTKAVKGKKKTDEHKQKISKSHIGITHTDKTKEILSKMSSKGTYTFISPNGKTFTHHSINQFAKEHKLSNFLLYSNVNKGVICVEKPGQLRITGKNTIGWQIKL